MPKPTVTLEVDPHRVVRLDESIVFAVNNGWDPTERQQAVVYVVEDDVVTPIVFPPPTSDLHEDRRMFTISLGIVTPTSKES